MTTPSLPAAPAAPVASGPVAPPTNGLAIASLVLSIVGFHLVGAILGHVALGRIKQTGESGRGIALAGIIIGWVALALLIIFTILVVVGALGTAFLATLIATS